MKEQEKRSISIMCGYCRSKFSINIPEEEQIVECPYCFREMQVKMEGERIIVNPNNGKDKK